MYWDFTTDKTHKIDRLIHDSGSNMAVKISSLVKKLMNVLKLSRVTAGKIHSFWIQSKETLWIIHLKYLVLDIIQRIHLHCGSFGSIICFRIFVKKQNICFRIKNLDLDVSKEMHPQRDLKLYCQSSTDKKPDKRPITRNIKVYT